MKRLIVLLCTLAVLAPASAAQAADLIPYTAPSVPASDLTVVLSPGESPTFNPDELELRLGLASGSLQGAAFTALPPACAGTLTDNGVPVSPYRYLTREQLSSLTFENTGSTETLAFTLLPNAGDAAAATLSYTSSTEHNSAPTATGGNYPALSATSVHYALPAADSDGDRLTYRLVDAPAKGDLRLEDGYFVYSPYPAAWGTDRFSYCALDGAGNLSPVAVVTLKIHRRTKGAVFADMNGSPYAYCATLLHDSGLMTGMQFGEHWFFGADQEVTVGDALVALAAVLGEDDFPAANADDAYGGAPAWLRPYLLWGIDAGYVEADAEAGTALTRAQAVMMVQRALGDGPVIRCNLGLQDVGAIPSEALPAYMTLTKAGVVNHYDGYCRPALPLTRDYWAELLWRLREYRQN